MKYELNEFYNVDCMEAMREFPDKYFDLAIVDPPYGGGYTGESDGNGLVGGFGEYKGSRVGRFGGRFVSYHLGNTKHATPADDKT